MATFYPSLDDQKLASFPESLLHSGNMMMYLNHASSAGSYSVMFPGSSAPSDDSLEIHCVEGRNEMMFIPPTGDGTSYGLVNTSAGDPIDNSVTGDPQVVSRTQHDMLDGEQNFQSQRLSLCLGTQMSSSASAPSFHYQYMNPSFDSSLSTHIPTSGEKTESCEGDGISKSKEMRNSECFPSNWTGGNHNNLKAESCNPQMHLGMFQCGPTEFSETILNSKYLKETQQLLHEVVNVQKAMKRVNSSKHHCIGLDASKETDRRSSSQSTFPTINETLSDATESNTNTSPELSLVDRQDLQNKKAKLLSMLDEVDRRYKQYYHQMQIVVSSFNSVSGCGAAKPYTTLARQTISRHFRCLRNSISGQIQVIRRRLGEQETGIPRLRSVDHQIQQQRALQQLGVTRHAWRPQRGLPESSVLTLRAWLFEHFLHPYPNDSEKIMLARQAGLTRNQVANWFINARVRLWKPMVEEMHNEEFGESEMNSKSIEDASKVPRDYCSASEDGGVLQDNTTSTALDVDSPEPGQVQNLKSDHISSVEINRSATGMVFQSGYHKDTVMHSGVIQLQDDHRPQAVDDHSLLDAATNDMSQLNGFGIGGQVSLALGLHHQESDVYSMPSGTHIRGSDTMSSFVEPGTMDYHCMDTGKQQLRFGSPHQLHDFIVGKNTCL